VLTVSIQRPIWNLGVADDICEVATRLFLTRRGLIALGRGIF
jgi:hypothetical protein